MTRPRKGSVAADLAQVKTVGVSHVLSMLQHSEARTLGLAEEEQAVDALGLTFLSYPIQDMHLPDADAFESFVSELVNRMEHGAHIAVHCRASIGRSGMVAACILGAMGVDGPEAIARISDSRGQPVPDTLEQVRFITQVCEALQR